MPRSVSDVLLYVPNLIGYARVFFALVGFVIAFDNHRLFLLFYVASFLLDAADGHFARLLNQCSRFGAVLDMVTDRCGTAGLVVVLSHLYPTYRIWFIFLIVLDIGSHWFRMYSSLMRGQTSHKSTDPKQNILLHIYYTNRIVLGGVCLMTELFYVFLYLSYFVNGSSTELGGLVTPGLVKALILLCAPVFLLKQVINVIQLVASCVEIVEYEVITDG